MSTRQDQKVATRQKLIRAAKKVVGEKGVDDAQITDITEVAGVSQGTFYVHFDSKEDLFKVLGDEFYDKMLRLIVSVTENNINNDRKISFEEIAGEYLDALKENRFFIVVYASKYGYSLPFDKLVAGVNPPLIDFISREIERSKEFLTVEPFDSVMLTHTLMAIWLRVGFRYALMEDGDRDSAISIIARTTKAIGLEFMPEAARNRVVF